ncbi:hypothetical protein I546_4904 [Mycobacterium kansasii 732]|nr:hypothetical protein I546_4904 [Mycobacterium kansasii 732]
MVDRRPGYCIGLRWEMRWRASYVGRRGAAREEAMAAG